MEFLEVCINSSCINCLCIFIPNGSYSKGEKSKQKTEKSASNDVDVYKINKNTSEAELKEKAETITKNYGVTVLFRTQKETQIMN